MDPDTTLSLWRRGLRFFQKTARSFSENLQDLTFRKLWRSKTVKLFVIAILFSEFVGLLIAVACTYSLKNNLYGGMLAIGSATTISYYSVTAAFYGFSWPMARFLSSRKKWVRLFFGDLALFTGAGALIDRLTWWLENFLGAFFLWLGSSEVLAIFLANVIQIAFYIPLATIACLPRLLPIREKS